MWYTLGYKTYQEYLDSPLWAIVRGRALAIHGDLCLRCKKPATQVHHKDYELETMTGEDVRSLMPVCKFCHRFIYHADKNGAEQHKRQRRSRKRPRCKCGRKKKSNQLFCRKCKQAWKPKQKPRPRRLKPQLVSALGQPTGKPRLASPLGRVV